MEPQDRKRLETIIENDLKGERSSISTKLDRIRFYLQKIYLQNQKEPSFPSFQDIWLKLDGVDPIEGFSLESANMESDRPTGRKAIVSFFKYGVLPLSVAAAGLLIVWNFMGDVPTAPGLVARITQIKGEAFLLDEEGNSIQGLSIGSSIPEGSRVLVKESSNLDMILNSKASIRIQGNTILRIESNQKKETSNIVQLFLENGTVLSHAYKMDKRSSFLVRTDLGLVSVRGTRFLTKKTNNSLLVAVSHGTVDLKKLESETSIEVVQKFQVIYESNEIVQTPITNLVTRELAQLDYVEMETPLDSSIERAIQSEDDLYDIYSILEAIQMDNGKLIRGVIYGMDDGFMYIRTVDGEVKIPQKNILDVEKIR
jgi:hypothetical protein